MSKCCIGLGNISYFYWYIFCSIIFNICRKYALKYTPILKEKEIIQSIYKYLGFSIFGLLSIIFIKKNISDDGKINHKSEKIV